MSLPNNWTRKGETGIEHTSGLLRISKAQGKKRVLYTVWRKGEGGWFNPPEPHHTSLEAAIKQAEAML